MPTINQRIAGVLAFAIAGAFMASPVFADKGGKGHGKDHDRAEQREDRGDNRAERRDDRNRGDNRAERRDDRDHDDRAEHRRVSRVEHFNDPHRGYVRDYYDGQYRAGRCPPGLAKKHNGCMPPGQAKKWDVGRPLPREVRYYEVPPTLIQQLGSPPPGYRYVRVDDNILLLATGTRMVVDAIRSLGRS